MLAGPKRIQPNVKIKEFSTPFIIQVEKSWYGSSFVYLRHKALQSQNFSPFQAFMGDQIPQLEHSKADHPPSHTHSDDDDFDEDTDDDDRS